MFVDGITAKSNAHVCPVCGNCVPSCVYVGTCVCVVGVVPAHVIYCCYGNVKAGGCMLVVWGVRWTGKDTGRPCAMHSGNSAARRRRR